MFVLQLSLLSSCDSLQSEGRTGGRFLSGLGEQVCKLNLGRFHPPPHPWQCDWSVSWLLEIIGEARIWQRLLLFLLPLYCPVTALKSTSSPPLHRALPLKVCQDFFPFLFFNIISLSPVLVHNHISFSIDRLFLSHILPLLYLRRVRLFNPMIWMQGSVSHAASLRIRARSLALWLLFICHKRQHTHTGAHTARSFGALSLPHYYSRVSHTHAHTHFCFSSSCPDTLLFLFDTHILPLPGKCSCDLLLPPDLSPQSPPPRTHRHTHAAIVCFISPFALLTSLVFYCRKLLLHSCVFIIRSDRKGPLSVCVCVCVCCPQWHSVVTAHTHTMQHSLSLCQTAIYFTHMHTHTCRKHAWQLHLCTHTHSVTPFLLLWRTHICSLGALWNSKRVCVCVWERVRACQGVREWVKWGWFSVSHCVCVCVTVHSCLTAGALHREAHTHTHTHSGCIGCALLLLLLLLDQTHVPRRLGGFSEVEVCAREHRDPHSIRFSSRPEMKLLLFTLRCFNNLLFPISWC